MRLRLAALAALASASCTNVHAQAPEPFTLDDAFARVAEAHPELRLLGARGEVLRAERDSAVLRPALAVGASIENAFGSGEARGLRSAEISLTLASVLERGGKLDARRTLAEDRIDALAPEREGKRLDLLAEVARRYLAIVAAREQHTIARADVEERRRAVEAATRRLHAGASPASVKLAAEAALARAELDVARAAQQADAAHRHLAALWGDENPAPAEVAGDPLLLPEVPAFAQLAEWLQRTPEIARFAGEQRVREARLQLARSAATPDLEWQLGVRRFEAGDDVGLVASVSIPLGASQRAEPGIRAAQAELVALEIEREAKGASLYSTLVDADGRYRVARLEVARLANDVLPRLSEAEAAAARAYRAGATSHLEWAQLLSEHASARRQQLDAAIEAQRALIEIQRLTGQPFVLAGASRSDAGAMP
ncbi:MAG: TolC family protein [Lysobacteraceae bacterium]|nr:MAG: TolC family protein [Xanthomonadaceae bacterium]